jgi:teichuronic acid biosynthesis glycosyltransferase TuaC
MSSPAAKAVQAASTVSHATRSHSTIAQSGSPRVLFVVPGDGQGSSMIFVRRQAESVAGQGLEVHLFHLASRTSPLAVMAEWRRFRSELARVRPAVVHAHFGTVTALFSALASGALPLVITYRGSDLNPPPDSYNWRAKVRASCGRLFSQLAALRAQRIVCVSRQLRNRLWWRRDLVTILPTGVDPETFCPAPRLPARRRLGWKDAERVVLFNAGRDPQVKRLDLALAAIEHARRLLPELRLEILDGTVPPAQLPEMMNAADCLLVTSVSEGSPTVVQEALASNLPIVSVEVGDVVERLEGVRDSTVASADPGVLGRALVSLVDPPRRSNGCDKVQGFSSHTVARKLKEIYEELA